MTIQRKVVFAATTGFNQTGSDPYGYNTDDNVTFIGTNYLELISIST